MRLKAHTTLERLGESESGRAVRMRSEQPEVCKIKPSAVQLSGKSALRWFHGHLPRCSSLPLRQFNALAIPAAVRDPHLRRQPVKGLVAKRSRLNAKISSTRHACTRGCKIKLPGQSPIQVVIKIQNPLQLLGGCGLGSGRDMDG